MILAVGLSPAWQQILEFDHLEPGEVNRARSAHWCGSGKVANVGIALHTLGGPAKMLSLAGGATGDQLRDDLAALGVTARWVSTATPTRVCTTLLDRQTGRTTELVENAASLAEGECDAFLTAFREEATAATMLVLTGSLPAGVPRDLYRRMLEICPVPAVLDIRGDELREALSSRPLIVKPNREELAAHCGRALETEADLLRAMRALNDGGAQWVVVSDGPRAVFVTSTSGIWKLTPPSAKVINPIGCGDCLAAGIAWALHHNRDPLEAVKIGMSAAAENLEQLLPARLDPASVLGRATQVIVSKVEG